MKSKDLPNTDIIHNLGLYFGNNPDLTKKEVDYIKTIFTNLKSPHLNLDELTPLDKKRLTKNLRREILLVAKNLNFELAAEKKEIIL